MKNLRAKYGEAVKENVNANVADFRKLQSELTAVYAESLDARREHSDSSHWDSAVNRDTWPADFRDGFCHESCTLVYHTNEIVSPLCVVHMVSGPSLCSQRDTFTEQRQ